MADRLTAQQFIDFGAHVMHKKITRTATIDNASISATDISDRVSKWGTITFEIYNQSLAHRGNLRFPVLTVEVKNDGNYFDRGGVIFPNPETDFDDTTLRVVVIVDGTTFLDFTGVVKEPEYSGTKALRLVAEHPLTAISRREWKLEDRIGGSTGIGHSFS